MTSKRRSNGRRPGRRTRRVRKFRGFTSTFHSADLGLCRRIGASDALRAWGAVERYPGPSVDTAEAVRAYVRETAITYHHQVGTCKMGTDAAAVVDSRLRVHGIESLRVADASVMPMVTTGNTNAPSIMIGERAAEFLIADA